MQYSIKNKVNNSRYKLLLIFMGMVLGYFRGQAQTPFLAGDTTIDIEVATPWHKVKREKTTWALKTNLLYAATLTPNIGLEIGISPRISFNITGGYNPWNREGKKGDNDKLVHWLVQPEVRYWFCEASAGHFIGIHGIATQYNIGGYRFFNMLDKNYRYEGWGAGGGISYGYSWTLSEKWGIETYFGVGVIRFDFDKSDNGNWCCSKSEHATKTYFGPTRIGISLIYNIK